MMPPEEFSIHPGEKLTVVIVDDHPTFRMGLVAIINAEHDMTVVGEAANGAEAVELCRQYRPSVLLTDLRMPEGSGFDAILSLRKHAPETKTVVLTTYDLDEDIYRALRAGAKAYLLKDSSRVEITDTIRRVCRDENIVPPRVESGYKRCLNREKLTDREREVLTFVVKGRANKEIATALFVTEDTVKSHLKSLFVKLGVSGRTEAAIEAVRSGLIHL